RVRCFGQNRLGDGYEARPARWREEASIRKQSLCPAKRTRGRRPLQRRELIVIGVAKRREAAKIEVALSIVLECRERGMFAEDRGGTRISERGAKAHPLGNFRHGPPIWLRLSRGRSEGALAGDSPLGIGHRSVLFSPGGGGQEHMRANANRIGRAHIIRDNKEVELTQGR